MIYKKYQITIEETISEVFHLEAENYDDAIEKAQGKYKSGEFVLAPGKLISKRVSVTEPNDKSAEWVEF